MRTLAVQVRKIGGLSKVSIHWHPGEKICMLFSIFWCQLSSVVLSRKVRDHNSWSSSEELFDFLQFVVLRMNFLSLRKLLFVCFIGQGV